MVLKFVSFTSSLAAGTPLRWIHVLCHYIGSSNNNSSSGSSSSGNSSSNSNGSGSGSRSSRQCVVVSLTGRDRCLRESAY